MEMKRNYNLLFLILIGLIIFGYFCTIYLIQIWNINSDFEQLYFSALSYLYFSNPYIQVTQHAVTHQVIVEYNRNLSAPLLVAIIAFFSHFFAYTRLFFIWGFVSTAALLSSIFLTQKYIAPLSRYHYFLPHLLILLLGSYTLINYTYGQCGLVFLLGMIAFTLTYQRNWWISAALVLAIMTAFKLFFLYFCILFLAKRQWKLLIAYLCFSLLLFFIPILPKLSATLSAYYHVTHHINWYYSNWNGSFLGFFIRLFGSEHHSRQLPLYAIPHLAIMLYYGFLGLYSAIGYHIFRKTQDPITCIGIATAIMLLLSPLGWYYYLPMLYPFFVYLDQQITFHKHKAWLQALLYLTLFFACLFFPNYIKKDPGMTFYLLWGQLTFLVLFLFAHLQLYVAYTKHLCAPQHLTLPTINKPKTLVLIMIVSTLFLCFFVLFYKPFKGGAIPERINIFNTKHHEYMTIMQKKIDRVKDQIQRTHKQAHATKTQ